MSNETLNLLLKQENNLLKNQVTALETKNLTSEQYGEVRTLYIENAILKERVISLEKQIKDIKSDTDDLIDKYEASLVNITEAKKTSEIAISTQDKLQATYSDMYSSSLTWYSVVLGIITLIGFLFAIRIRRQEVKDLCQDAKSQLSEDQSLIDIVAHTFEHATIAEKLDILKGNIVEELQKELPSMIHDKVVAYSSSQSASDTRESPVEAESETVVDLAQALSEVIEEEQT
ncbi:hypothetical protein [Aeromonas hydrophila]|uniref:hypothetical protein n=2 Tax=Aeromonas TaxID=642 RepID=UPI000E115E73|nr:hypothetical protein [Aeromonas hydrophila]MBS4673130.1 hypothetical protein [Aeromonas hydrophila]SUU16357.1 Uncharacterised protein [Aeromonas hydrophila]